MQYQDSPADPADYLPPRVEHIAPGIEMVTGFENKEEFLGWIAKNRAEVQARPLADEQLGIGYGQHAVRFLDNVAFFYYVPTLEEQDEDPEVLDDVDYKQRTQNMLWVMGYSTQCPDGEWGFAHRSTCWPISPRLFEVARAAEWDMTRMPPWARADLLLITMEMRAFWGAQNE